MRIKKYYKLIRVDYEDTEYFRIKNTSDTAGVFTITGGNSPYGNNLKYSFDTVNWVTADLTADFSLEVEAGANLYLKGTNSHGFNTNYNVYKKMAMDVNHSIGGNIMSIVDEENYATITSIPESCFVHLFDGDTHLVDVGDMNFGNVTSIGNYGCYSMYSGCTSLTTPSDLSSVTSIGYSGCQYMYQGCTSLTTPSDLSSVTSIGGEGCYSMYSGCTSLTTPSDLSSVTSIGDSGCYNMYQGCTSLTTPSDLSSVTSIGYSGCQYMYQGCTSLTTPSDLSSVTSIGGEGCGYMYQGCTSLTTPSDLSSVTSIGDYGCYNMYYGCTSLTTATAPNVSTWDTSIFNSWLYKVASTGVVRKPAGLTIPTGSTSGIPSGWTTVDY